MTDILNVLGAIGLLLRVLWHCYELSRNQWLSSAELKRLQEKRLRAILRHAYENVPLYHKKFDSVGVKPDDIRAVEDLSKLPFTTKEEIKIGIPDQSVAKGYNINKCVKWSTSGTSGESMPVYYDKRRWDYFVAAHYFRMIRAMGFSPWDKTVKINYHMQSAGERSYELKHKSRGREAFGRAFSLLRGWRKVVYVSYSAEEIVPEVIKYQPKIIESNPFYLRLVAEAMADKGIENVRPKALETSGEVLDEPTRRFLEFSFKCKVFDHYATNDTGLIVWECRRREGYHIDADLSIVEIVRNGEPVEPHERGEIVVTGLLNYAMPVIRYRVGDIGMLDAEQCSCGRTLPLLKSVEGRAVDCFILPNGQIVSPKIIMSAIQGTRGVSKYQVVQESRNKVTIELTRREVDPEVSVNELAARCRGILGDDVEIEVFVGGRESLKAKFRPVISKLTVSGHSWIKPRG